MKYLKGKSGEYNDLERLWKILAYPWEFGRPPTCTELCMNLAVQMLTKDWRRLEALTSDWTPQIRKEGSDTVGNHLTEQGRHGPTCTWSNKTGRLVDSWNLRKACLITSWPLSQQTRYFGTTDDKEYRLYRFFSGKLLIKQRVVTITKTTMMKYKNKKL